MTSHPSPTSYIVLNADIIMESMASTNHDGLHLEDGSKLLITGKSELEIYKNSTKIIGDMLCTKYNSEEQSIRIKRSIMSKSNKPALRLQKFLIQVLEYSYEDHSVFPEMAIEVLSNNDVRALLFGCTVSDYQKKIIPKSLVVLSLDVKNGRLWEANIIFDISK